MEPSFLFYCCPKIKYKMKESSDPFYLNFILSNDCSQTDFYNLPAFSLATLISSSSLLSGLHCYHWVRSTVVFSRTGPCLSLVCQPRSYLRWTGD